MKKRATLLGIAAAALGVTLVAGCVSSGRAPADPTPLALPIFEPLVRNPEVTITWISVNGETVPGGALERAVRHYDDMVAADVHLLEGAPVALDLDDDGAVSRAQFDAIITGSQRRGPFQIVIVIAPDFEFADNPAEYQYEYTYSTEPAAEDRPHAVLVNGKAMKANPTVPVFYPKRDWWAAALTHELLHSLGLPSDRSRLWYDGHCTNPGCVLYPGVIDARSLRWVILHRGPPLHLCEACRQELEDTRAKVPGYTWWNPEEDYRLAWFDQAVYLNPDNPEAYAMRLKVSRFRKDYPLMIADASILIELEPENPDRYYLRGKAYTMMGRFADAVPDLEIAIDLDENHVGALKYLAWILATAPDERLRDGQRAVEQATRASALREWKDAGMLDTLAAACAEAGDFEAAVGHQSAAIELLKGDGSGEAYNVEGVAPMQRRLDLYTGGIPYHISLPSAAGDEESN